MCGISGIITRDRSEAVPLALLTTKLQQNRGHAGAGIAFRQFSEPSFWLFRKTGKVDRLASQIQEIEELGHSKFLANLAIAQNRYATSGTNGEEGLQPMVTAIDDKQVAIVFNGNLVQWRAKARELGLDRSIVDTKFILEVLSRSVGLTPEERIHRTFSSLRGAFSIILLWGNRMFAIKGTGDFRPLWVASTENGTIVTSEDSVLQQIHVKNIQRVAAGQVLELTPAGPLAGRQLDGPDGSFRCTLCTVYFARANSSEDGPTTEKSFGMERFNHGKLLAQAWKASGTMPDHIDCVIPMMQSGSNAAMGVAHELNLEAWLAIIRDPEANRNFLEKQADGIVNIHLKHAIDAYMVKEKIVVVVDDSFIRGRTAKKIVEELLRAGAQAVYWLVASPPYQNTCHWGIATSDRGQLLLAPREGRTLQEMVEEARTWIQAAGLFFLPLETFQASFDATVGHCFRCFGGLAPVGHEPDELDLATHIPAA